MEEDLAKRLIDLQNNMVLGFRGLFNRLDGIQETLNKLVEQQGAAAPVRNDPREDARWWFRKHAIAGCPASVVDSYLECMEDPKGIRTREEAADLIAFMCYGDQVISEEEACTTECARQAMALMRISGKCSPDYLRRAIGAAIRKEKQRENPEA